MCSVVQQLELQALVQLTGVPGIVCFLCVCAAGQRVGWMVVGSVSGGWLVRVSWDVC